jgi:hypothetical protein
LRRLQNPLLNNSGASWGFTGKQIIHPDQVAVVHESFSPSSERVKWAKELINVNFFNKKKFLFFSRCRHLRNMNRRARERSHFTAT